MASLLFKLFYEIYKWISAKWVTGYAFRGNYQGHKCDWENCNVERKTRSGWKGYVN